MDHFDEDEDGPGGPRAFIDRIEHPTRAGLICPEVRGVGTHRSIEARQAEFEGLAGAIRLDIIFSEAIKVREIKPATFMGGTAAAAQASARPAPATPAPAASAATPAARQQQGASQRRLQQGQVYSYVKDGVRHYSSSRPAGGAQVAAVRTIRYSFFETCYACGAAPGVNFGSVRLNENAYRDEVARASREFGVEEAIVRAIMHAESAFNPNALSRAGAQGLMQLMPATAARFGVVNAFDPEQNIRGGVEYLAWLLKRFNGDLTLAAAGYNAGEGAVQRHGGVPPYAETQRYVVRVGTLADRYRGQLASR